MKPVQLALCQLTALIFAAHQPADAANRIIRNVRSGLVLDVVGAQTNDGQPVILFQQNGGLNQLFDMKDFGFTSPGNFQVVTIIAKHSGLCIANADFSAHTQDNGIPIVQTVCRTGGQNWIIEPIGKPKSECGPPGPGCFPIGFKLESENGKCLDARNPKFPTPPLRGAVLQQFTCARDINDRWFVNQTFKFEAPP